MNPVPMPDSFWFGLSTFGLAVGTGFAGSSNLGKNVDANMGRIDSVSLPSRCVCNF